MAWQDEITIMVRTLINDLGENPTYSDERLQQVIAVAAKYVEFDVVLDKTYLVDVVTPSITPDPTIGDDNIFIALVSLKASCIIDQSTYRTKAGMEGIRASLGPASLSISGQSAALKAMLELGPCAAYDELTAHWDVKEATAIRAILSPFVGNNFNPRYIQSYGYRDRDFYS